MKQLMNAFSTIRNIVYFDEKNYIEQNKDVDDIVLAQKQDKKTLQLVLCGGGIGAGIVAAFITGSTSIICSALSARHANVLRQQQKLLGEIQQARQENWLSEAATVRFPFSVYSSTDPDSPFINTGGLIVIRHVPVVPRPMSRAAFRCTREGAHINLCPNHMHDQRPATTPDEESDLNL